MVISRLTQIHFLKLNLSNEIGMFSSTRGKYTLFQEGGGISEQIWPKLTVMN